MNAQQTKPLSAGALWAWFAILILGLLGLAVCDAAMLRLAEGRRALDYRWHLSRSGTFLSQGNVAAAKAAINRALQLAPDAPDARLLEGHLYYQMGQWESAIAAYDAARHTPDPDPGAFQNAVWALIQLGRYVEAVALGEQAIAAQNDSPVLRRYVGEACYRAKDWHCAVLHLEQALESSPGDLYLMDHLRESYLGIGDTARARTLEAQINETEAGFGLGPKVIP